MMTIIPLNDIGSPKPSAEMVKRPAVSSENPSGCPTEGAILLTGWPGKESRPGTLRCPRARWSQVGARDPPPWPGRGRPSSRPRYLCALGKRSPRACPRPPPGAESAGRGKQKGKRREAGGGSGRSAGRGAVTLVHRPHGAEGLAVPPSQRSLSLHLEGTGARRAG